MTEARPYVLVIDDEPATARMIQAFLRLYGFETAAAHTGKAGMQAITERRPDVLVLDLMLPDIDGLALCRQLREQPSTASLPVVILSARVTRQDIRLGFEAGATRYLKKPVDLDRLVSQVREVFAEGGHHPTPPEPSPAGDTPPGI